jgi:fatty acid desaturase
LRNLPKITDPVYIATDKNNNNENFWIQFINDQRDLPFIYLIIKITLTILPLGVLLFFPLPDILWWLIAITYFILNNFIFKGPFGLMLHCTSHRILFKKKYALLNHYIPWVLGPFFGQTPETYYSHHMVMHHIENNLEDDLSSTMNYQRDSFRDFLRYFTNFLFTGFYNLTSYFNRNKRIEIRNKVIFGEVSFFLFCILLCFISIKATMVVFILPFIIARFIMMLGNWAQHSFVDYDDPGNCFKNSITCINTSYNHKCWNDGYHINHHLKPSRHYLDYPLHFQKNLTDFSSNKAIVFEGIHYLHVWWYVINKNYKKLSEHIVNINGMFKNEEEAIALLKSRTSKMPLRGMTFKALRLSSK